MHIYFVSSSIGKYQELSMTIPNLTLIEHDLDEIQSLDSKSILSHKLSQASSLYPKKHILVEDTSLEFEGMGGLPGPLVKWFLKGIGVEGLASIVPQHPHAAVARTVLALETNGDQHFFEGVVEGTIVPPRGSGGFGWDPLFVPHGYKQTFAELDQASKNEISMRSKAAHTLKLFLDR